MKLSVQLFTLREPLERDTKGTLQQLARIGFQYVELAGYYGHSPFEMRSMLDDCGLKISGSHVSIDALKTDFDTVVAENKLLDNKYVIVPWIPGAIYAAGWEPVAALLDGYGGRLREQGLSLAYHNHSFELQPLPDGRVGLDILYQCSDPSLVLAQIDTAWIYHGALEPAEYIRQLAGRVPLVHLKDIVIVAGEARDSVAGRGELDWPDILAACDDSGVEFGAIEMDRPPGDPVEDVRQCYDFFVRSLAQPV